MEPLKQGLRTRQIKKMVKRHRPSLAEGMRYQGPTYELVKRLKKLSEDPRMQNQTEEEYRAALEAAIPGLLEEARQEERTRGQEKKTATRTKEEADGSAASATTFATRAKEDDAERGTAGVSGD